MVLRDGDVAKVVKAKDLMWWVLAYRLDIKATTVAGVMNSDPETMAYNTSVYLALDEASACAGSACGVCNVKLYGIDIDSTVAF